MASSGCSAPTATPDNFTEERLRARIALVWSHFVDGNFDAYVAMWSARRRPAFRETEEDWEKTIRNWKLFLALEKPTFELVDLTMMGQRAKVKMRGSVLEKGGLRVSEVSYDYWVFENGDWFLDAAARTE